MKHPPSPSKRTFKIIYMKASAGRYGIDELVGL